MTVFEDPNEANAPDPSPNAVEAPLDGVTRPAAGVVALLNGFDLLCDESKPLARLLAEKLRDESILGKSLFVLCCEDDEVSLLELNDHINTHQCAISPGVCSDLARRAHKLSMKTRPFN